MISSLMLFFQAHSILFLLLMGTLVFLSCYFSADKINAFIVNRTSGQLQETMVMLEKLGIDRSEADVRKGLTWLSVMLFALVVLGTWPNVSAGIPMGLLLAVLVWTLPPVLLKSQWEKYCNDVVNGMVDGLSIMANALRSQSAPIPALETVTEVTKGPLSRELKNVLRIVRTSSVPLEDALLEFAARIPRADVQIFVTSMNILLKSGGRLPETLTTIVNTIRERQKLEKKVEAMTAQSNTQAAVMSAAPFLMFVGLLIFEPDWVQPLVSTTQGWLLLVLMLVLIIIGSVVMKRMVKIDL